MESLRTNAYLDVYEQYVEEASFLWELRSGAVKQPHYHPSDIKVLEQRIQAHLDGLLTAPEIAWRICKEALEDMGPGEVFTASVVAFRRRDRSEIREVIETALLSHDAVKGLISAMAWLPSQISRPWTDRFLQSKNVDHNYLAVAVCSLRREDPGDHLTRFLRRHDALNHGSLRARCLRIIGELKRHDLIPALNQGLACDNEDVAFWANWSAILLGNKAVVKNMESYFVSDSPHHDRALDIAFRALSMEHARGWISRLASDSRNLRSVIKAIGVLGDPHFAGWLIHQMENPLHARLAGESFTMITGIDLEQHELNQAPADQEDYDAIVMEDENLPWPDAARIRDYWNSVSDKYTPGTRYLLGKPVEPEFLKDKTESVQQRHRRAIALELALRETDEILPNIKGKII